jgi:hypothetical protein
LKFVSNLAENGFPLEARVGIKAVHRFKQSTNSLREKPEVKARNEKPAVQSWQAARSWKWASYHILQVGGCRKTEFSGKVRPNPATAATGIALLI